MIVLSLWVFLLEADGPFRSRGRLHELCLRFHAGHATGPHIDAGAQLDIIEIGAGVIDGLVRRHTGAGLVRGDLDRQVIFSAQYALAKASFQLLYIRRGLHRTEAFREIPLKF